MRDTAKRTRTREHVYLAFVKHHSCGCSSGKVVFSTRCMWRQCCESCRWFLCAWDDVFQSQSQASHSASVGRGRGAEGSEGGAVMGIKYRCQTEASGVGGKYETAPPGETPMTQAGASGQSGRQSPQHLFHKALSARALSHPYKQGFSRNAGQSRPQTGSGFQAGVFLIQGAPTSTANDAHSTGFVPN